MRCMRLIYRTLDWYLRYLPCVSYRTLRHDWWRIFHVSCRPFNLPTMSAIGSFEDPGLRIQDSSRQFESLETLLCLFRYTPRYNETLGQVNIFTRGFISPTYLGLEFNSLWEPVQCIVSPEANRCHMHRIGPARDVRARTSLRWRQRSEASIVNELSGKLDLFQESSFLWKISPIFFRERVLMYCDFQYMNQLANLGLYVPKGYVRVPSYHKDWRTHIFTIKTWCRALL